MNFVRLGDVCEVSWGDTSKTKASYVADGFPAFSASGRDGFLPHFDHEGPGIVVSAIGAQCGKTWFTDGRWSCIKNTIYLKSSSPHADTRYVFYATANPDAWPKRGAAQPFISQTDAKNVEIPLPPLPVQQRIAGILSAYDELIENSQRRIKILEAMARALYREWFVHFRFPGFENHPRVASPLGDIPQGWEVKKIQDFGKVITGKTPSKANAAYFGDEVQFLKTPDMHGNMFILGTNEHLSAFGAASQANKTLPAGSICVSCIGTIGVVSITTEECQTNQQINSIMLTNAASREFLFLRLQDAKQALENLGSNGATIGNVNKGKFEAMEIVGPPAVLLSQYHQLAQPMFLQILALARQIQNLRRTRDLLLPRLLSGQIALDAAEENVRLQDAGPLPAEQVPPCPSRSNRTGIAKREVPPEPREASRPISMIEREKVLCTIRKVFSDSVERDRDTSLRDIAHALGYQRLGTRIRDELSAGFMAAVRRGIVVNEGGAYRLGFRAFADCPRDTLKEVFESAIGRAWVTREEAIRAFARWAGFARVGEVIDQTARSLINGLIREGRVETDGPDLIRRT